MLPRRGPLSFWSALWKSEPCSVDHLAWLSALLNELQGTMQSVLVHPGLSLKTTARSLFSRSFKVCFKNCPDSAAKRMDPKTHEAVIAGPAAGRGVAVLALSCWVLGTVRSKSLCVHGDAGTKHVWNLSFFSCFCYSVNAQRLCPLVSSSQSILWDWEWRGDVFGSDSGMANNAAFPPIPEATCLTQNERESPHSSPKANLETCRGTKHSIPFSSPPSKHET